MPTRLEIAAIAAALAMGMSGAAMAQYSCPSGYTYYRGACQPVGAPAPTGPVSGAVSGGASGAAAGNAAAGPVGGVVGGAVGTATGAVTGTVGAATGAVRGAVTPRCAAGYTYYNGACYPGGR